MRFRTVTVLAIAALCSAQPLDERSHSFTTTGVNVQHQSTVLKKKSFDPNTKIRGVNIGSLFVFERWIDTGEWANIGCGSAVSEFDCGLALGQDGVNAAFQKHWQEYYTEDDITQIVALGLNTIRIPVGYWMYEDIVDRSSEPFPQGGFPYLQQLCGWASNANLNIIIDLHGAPGAQVANNSDTGQFAPTPGFYNTRNYGRATQFLSWMTTYIHNTSEFRNVIALEVVNEPLQGGGSQDDDMRQNYYPAAYQAIRDAENSLNVAEENQILVQFMDSQWSSGDPNQYLSGQENVLYDDHRYIKWAYNQVQTKDAYMSTSCNDNLDGDGQKVVGEWSLSAPLDDTLQWTSDWDPSQNTDWYLGWGAAQMRVYEKQLGWIFWTWKAALGDPRWSYKDAVNAGLIYQNLDDIYSNNACNGY